jgi:hypothetical protein
VVALELRRRNVIADAWRRCADDPATLLRLDRMLDGQGLLVPKHRAEIAHVKPAFRRVK